MRFSFLVLFGCVCPLFAAPVPGVDEKPKPRAKLLGTLVVNARVDDIHWMPDGKHLVLVGSQQVFVYPRDQIGADKPKPLTVLDRPQVYGAEVRPTADGGLWILAPAGQKVNAENRLHIWTAKTLLAGGEPKADRVVDLEADSPVGLVPAADGGSIFATVMNTRTLANGNQNGPRMSYEYVPKFLRLSAKTGDVVHQVAFTDLSQDRYAGSAFDPRTDRVYLAVHAEDETVISCRDLQGSKPIWERKLPLKPDVESLGVFTLSPDGSRLAYRQPTLTVQQPGGGFRGPGAFPPGGGGRPQQVSYTSTSSLVTLDAKTGELGASLAKGDITGGRGHSFSSEGRLLFADIGTLEGSHLGVWDVKGGTELKVWSRRGFAEVSGEFAPNGYELAIVEREQKQVLGPQVAVPEGRTRDGGQQWGTRQEVVRVDYTSTIGVWDLSPVVK